MNTAFTILPEAKHIPNLRLLATAGDYEISLLFYTTNPFTVHGFSVYNLLPHTSVSDYVKKIKDILNPEQFLPHSFVSQHILFNGKSSLPVPAEFFKDEHAAAICDMVFGTDRTSDVFYDGISKSDLHNVYRINKNILNTVQEILPQPSYKHATSVFLENYVSAGSIMECVVSNTSAKVFLFKENNILLVQYFEYNSPMDACYHLLNVCERFGLMPGEVQLKLSGMIDEHSHFYKEIYKYFLQVSFSALPEGTVLAGNVNEQPHHFYAHLSALAQCVS